MSKNALAIVLLLVANASFAQQLDIRLTEQLSIGDNESAPLEYLFAGPIHIATDAAGNIYVADDGSSVIRVFDHQGVFLYKVGKRGRGPGELLIVSGMAVDDAGNLLVSDQRTQRVTRFMKTGDVETYPIGKGDFVYMWSLHSLGNGMYGLFYRLSRESEGPKMFFHVYDSTFSERLFSCVPIDDFYNEDDLFQLTFSFNRDAVNLAVYGNTYFAAPGNYGGKIYRYKKRGNGCVPSVHPGMGVRQPAYELYDSDLFLKPPRPAGSRLLSGPYGSFAMVQYVESNGLFTLRDGSILHLVQVLDESDNVTFYLELFAPSGAFIGYGKVDDIVMHDSGRQLFYLKWVDENDQLYFVDYTSGFPVIRVMKLRYERL